MTIAVKTRAAEEPTADNIVRIVLWELKKDGAALSCGGFGQPTEFGYIYTKENRVGKTRRFPAGARLILELPADAPVEYEGTEEP